MDKYEFNIKVEQIKKLMKKKDYITAVKIADTIDWEKVKQKQLLIMAADVYEIAGKYDDARDVLLLAYERTGLGRQLAYRLCRLSVKRGDFAEAEEFYEEFVHNSPLDAGKYILSYEISKGRGESAEKQILMLEAYIEEDMDDRWAYELAKLYHRARFRDKCVEMCDTIILWFAEGKYVEKAMELKQVYEPLSESQRIKYEAQKSRKAEELELVRNEEEETEQQLQVSVMDEKVKKEPKSKRELKLESEPKYEPKSEIRSQSSLKPESVSEPVLVEKKNGDILDEVNEVDIDINSIHVRDYSVNNKYDTVNLQKELARSVSSLFDNTIDIFKPNVKRETEENEDKFVDDQIEGQMHLEEVLAMFESGELRVKDDSKETKEQVAEVAEEVTEQVIEDAIEDIVIEEKVETIEELEIVAEPIVEVEEVIEEKTESIEDVKEVTEAKTESIVDVKEVTEAKTESIEDAKEVIEEQQKSIADIEEVVNEIEVIEEKTIEVEEKTTEIEEEKQKEEKALEVAEKEAIIAMLSENNTKKKSRKKRKISKDKRVADIIAGEIAAMQAFEDDLSPEDDFYEEDEDYEDEIAKIAEDSGDKDVNKLAKERNVQMFDLKQENEDKKVDNPKPEEKIESPKSEEKLESIKLEEKATKTPSESAKEELKNFIARFAGVQGLDKQILKVMQSTLKIDKSAVKFIFVKGEVKSGKTTLAIEVLKLANKLMQRRDQRIAKIKAENINGKSVSGLLKKLDGSDVLIERVSDMDVDTFVEFIDKVKEENRERIVIFEDEKSLADAFLEKVPQSYATFANILDIRQNKIKDWARMAENYANSKGYALDEMGTLALSAKIDQLRAITLVVHKDHIEQLVDGAIKNRNRLSLSRLFGRGGGKNEEGLKLLTERDFSL